MSDDPFQPVKCRGEGAYLIELVTIEQRDQDVGEHVAHEHETTDSSRRR